MKVNHHESSSVCSVTEFSFYDASIRLRQETVFYINMALVALMRYKLV
jgi:hypothetical protein